LKSILTVSKAGRMQSEHRVIMVNASKRLLNAMQNQINVFSLVALVRCGHIGIRRNFSERIVYKNGIGKLID